MHRSHSSLSSFDDIRELQAYRQRQLDLTRSREDVVPKTALVRPFSVDGNELNYVHPLVLTQRRRDPTKRAASTIGIVQWTSSFVVKDANEQRALIRYPDQFPVCSMHLAAIRIQRWWRSLDSLVRTKRSDRRLLTNPHWTHPYQQYIDHVRKETLHLTRRSFVVVDMSSTESILTYFNRCATVVQRAYRSYRCRKFARYQRRMLYQKAACSIQRAWRLHIHRRDARAQRFINSVITIQRAWRSFSDRRVYRYFRSLIRSREASDPYLILQAMGELDKASGLYIRFRLGGSQFPPLIYFKVFTKHTVTDIGSFAPRNYALDDRRHREYIKSSTGQKHTMRSSQKSPESATDVSAWYRRYENNGWRLMSTLHLNSSSNQHHDDEITVRTSNVRMWHHPNKLVRAADARRKRKDKQIAWRRELYGTPNQSAEHEEKESVVFSKLPQLVTKNGRVYVDELQGSEEVDDLLSWCTSLSFDDYADTWSSMGTTLSQERPPCKFPSVTR